MGLWSYVQKGQIIYSLSGVGYYDRKREEKICHPVR